MFIGRTDVEAQTPIFWPPNAKHGRLRPGTLSAAERRYPTSEVRGSGRECQAATAQEWLRGATQVQGRGGGREEQPHIQGAVAAQVQEDMEELSHIEGQEGWW